MRQHSLFRTIPVLLLFFALAAVSACAVKQNPVESLLAKADGMDSAIRFLGHPSTSRDLGDGSTRHEWLLDNSYHESGKWVMRRVPGIYSDSDGYPVDMYRPVWQKPREVRKFCRISVIADRDGRIVNSSWEGDSCEDLIRQTPSPEREPFFDGRPGVWPRPGGLY